MALCSLKSGQEPEALVASEVKGAVGDDSWLDRISIKKKKGRVIYIHSVHLSVCKKAFKMKMKPVKTKWRKGTQEIFKVISSNKIFKKIMYS